ncbi:nucleotidyltransferase domain-containing protein [Microbacterium gorillae]|uniref:nucleotidyltransferase domain-containing protein n=1 Tax=Microbacterium gorillae TaxID=1231063 RepID=UPI00058AD867|nr:hypothetical protein [Microbacterium gorillae]
MSEGLSAEDVEFFRVYGAWAPRTPSDAAALMAGYDGLWWIAGGWAIDVLTGGHRSHHDIDLGVLRHDLPALRTHLSGTLDIWAAFSGALKPLITGATLPPDTGNLWLRRDATSLWEYDVLLSPGDERTWVYKRDPTLTMPMSDAIVVHDGVRYLRAEIQLLYKARAGRAQDEADFVAALPLLSPASRGWLTEALERTEPGHPWLARL